MSETIDPVESHAKYNDDQSELEKKVSKIMIKIFSKPVSAMLAISSVLMFVIMLLVTLDVLGRYIFSHPITGADELVGLLLLCVAACAFSYTQKEHRHIRIELFTEKFRPKLRLSFDIFNYLISLGIFGLITWRMAIAAHRFILNLQGGSSVSEMLGIPFSLFLIILGLGFAILTLVILSDLILTLVKVGKR